MKWTKSKLPVTAYRVGMSVLANVFGEIVKGEVFAIADQEIGVRWGSHVGKYVEDFNVKPICRPLSSLTEDEAREVYRLSYGEKFKVKGWDGRKKTALAEVTYADYLDGIQDSVVGRALYDIAVVDYLDFIGIDTRGWIEKSLAIDRAKLFNTSS